MCTELSKTPTRARRNRQLFTKRRDSRHYVLVLPQFCPCALATMSLCPCDYVLVPLRLCPCAPAVLSLCPCDYVLVPLRLCPCAPATMSLCPCDYVLMPLRLCPCAPTTMSLCPCGVGCVGHSLHDASLADGFASFFTPGCRQIFWRFSFGLLFLRFRPPAHLRSQKS